MKSLIRPDGSLVHVLLTTIPPLGLTGAREQVREEVNEAILSAKAKFNADGLVDFDAAVAGSVQGQVNPSYLTNGTPNAAYYQALANAVVDAEANQPPTAQL